MSRSTWWALIRTPMQDWPPGALDDFTREELAGICQLLGISYTGTKARLRERIARARHLRLVLAGYDTDSSADAARRAVETLAANYRADELLALCRAADVYAGTTKYSRAAALLEWRNGCRQRGGAAWDAARAAVAGQPRQLRLLTTGD